MKSRVRHLVLGLLLAMALPSSQPLAAQSAEQILLDKANYWRLKDRPDLAAEALQKLLSINPNQPEALYQYGVIAVQQGKIDDARGYLTRLQKASPGSNRITELENAIRAGQVSPNELSEARKLAQSGQFSQAAQKYQQTFKGPPPPTFGVEYYMTLAGTARGWEEAHKGLQTLVQNSPNDSKAKLALAEVETYRAETRARGIRSLAQLSDDSVAGAQATQAWKQALMWLDNTAEDRQLYNQYLAKNPSDADMREHVADIGKRGAAGAASPGYADLNRGNVAGAERQFEDELRRNPNDAAALAGLGIVRLRQHRLPQARELLSRAVSEYRKMLASTPNDPAAQSGLRGALVAQRSVETAGRPSPAGPGGTAGPAINPVRTRADALRAEGRTLEARGDLANAGAKYQEAIAVDPRDPWARVDYARFLARRGDVGQAFAIVDPAASGNTAESLYAAALLYNEMNRPVDALTLLDRIPAGSSTADINAFHARILATAEIARAKQLAKSGNRMGARSLLLALSARPPASAEKTAAIADALNELGFTQEALQLGRPNPATAAANRKAVLDYAGLLFRAGRDAEAVAYLQQAESSGRITAADRQELEHIKVDIAARRADQLRERGDYAGAWDQISALLAAYPNDPVLLLAAGRIYASAGYGDIGMRFTDAAFQHAPNDLGVIRGAIGGSIVAGDLDRARAYLAHGLQRFPGNPRLIYMDAEIARASGDNGRALYDLQIARRLDNPQAGLYEALPPLPRGNPGALPPPPSNLPPNPFRRAAADGSPRPIQLASAAVAVSATDAVDAAPPTPDVPLQQSAISADSDDLIVPPRAGERVRRQKVAPVPVALPPPPPLPGFAAADGGDTDAIAGSDVVTAPSSTAMSRPRHLAQLEPLPPPPIPSYQQQTYPQPIYTQPQPVYTQPQPVYMQPQPVYTQTEAVSPLQPLPPPPIPGYQPPPTAFGQPTAPAPRDSLESDIERSMAAIAAEAGPTMQGGLAFRVRDGERGLSQLTEIGAPIEGTFSPFFTGTVRLQAIPTFLDAGRPGLDAALRFGSTAFLALNPANNLGNIPLAGSQTASGVSLNLAYAYQMFDAEIGTTPLGFPVENLVGRLALVWPPPATVTTAFPTIGLAPNGGNPWRVVAEAVRKPITDSLLSYAGTKDPVTGLVWGGVVKTGGDLLVSYDDGDVGFYAGGGGWAIDGKSVQSNSEFEGLVGAYVRPWRSGSNAFKVGLNLSYMGYDKNLSFFTFGQGGYFSPQSYVNLSVPLEYSGRRGRWTYLVGGAIGVQTFHQDKSPFFPTAPGKQAALEAAFGNLAFFPAKNVTGPAFSFRGQAEYQLNNGFSIGGIAGVDNAQNFTEGIAKVYLRKSFGLSPSTALLPYSPLPGSL